MLQIVVVGAHLLVHRLPHPSQRRKALNVDPCLDLFDRFDDSQLLLDPRSRIVVVDPPVRPHRRLNRPARGRQAVRRRQQLKRLRHRRRHVVDRSRTSCFVRSEIRGRRSAHRFSSHDVSNLCSILPMLATRVNTVHNECR